MFFFNTLLNRARDPVVDTPSDITELIKKYKCDNEPSTKKTLERLARRIANEGSADDLQQLLSSPLLNVVHIDIDTQNKDGLNALGYIENKLKRPQTLRYEQCKNIIFEYKNMRFKKQIRAMTVHAICQFLNQAIQEGNWVGVKFICDLPVGPNKPENLYNAVYELEKTYKTTEEYLLAEGPFEKSILTVQLENFMRKLMRTGQFTIVRNEKKDVIFAFDDEQFNWSNIIRSVHLEHITLTKFDFILYQNYMESLKQNDLIDKEEMFAYLPTLEREKLHLYQEQLYKGTEPNNTITFEEMSAINIYTGILFFSSMNELIRGNYSFLEEDSIFKSKIMETRHAIIQLVICASGLNKLSLPRSITTYRGESLYYSQDILSARIKAAAQNTVIPLMGFVSTNTEDKHPYTRSDTQYTFHNVRGICIAPISRFPLIEQELIMLPTQVQLLSYQYKHGQHFFEGRCVRDLNNSGKTESTLDFRG